MRYIFNSNEIGSYLADIIALGVFNGDNYKIKLPFCFADILSFVELELKRRDFNGKEGEAILLPLLNGGKIKHLLFLGLGEKKKFQDHQLRSLSARIVKQANGVKAKTVILDQTLLSSIKNDNQATQALVEGFELGSYQFTVFKKHTEKDELKKKTLIEVIFSLKDAKRQNEMQKGIKVGLAYAQGTILARDLVNTPSMDMHPAEMVKVALSLSSKNNRITCKVLNSEKMAKLGMHASLAVGRASKHESLFVHLNYKPKKQLKNTKKIVLIGKAVTFDSGGLNLKPENGMTDMKIDMAGAASVLGIFKALPELDINVEVHGLFIAVENMPGGSAYRPGDVVSAMDGTTIEVENTDAEGRITLADALAYASLKIKPDQIIDLATLTGAVIIALGSEITGMLGTSSEIKKALQLASKQSGEHLWELPLHHHYRELIKSKIADVKNVGGRPAGVITAAQFLEKFTHNVPWVHLDIAGPSYAEKEFKPEVPVGGTGWGVRTLLNYLRAK